jgi:succinyl-CoA synthetase beta subunit
MKLHEHQSKSLMAQYGIPVPGGGVASTPAEARGVAQGLGGRVVVKAQVHAGGRGKGGGIRLVEGPAEAEQAAASLLGTRLVTPQTGTEGAPVHQVLVEEASEVQRELYLAVVVDGGSRSPVVIASQAGGMEIEEVAETSPEKVLRVVVDPALGFQPYQGRRLAYALELPQELVRPAAELMANLYRLFQEKDCSLAEINPLVVTADGRLLALDAKLNLDDDAAFRHKELRELRDVTQEDAMEAEATDHSIAYVHLDGDVGCLVNGAGLAMATMDTVRSAGGAPANFLDVGGGADEEKVSRAMGIILADPRVKRVLLNIFGGILRCDIVSRGVATACQERGSSPPMVVRMLGTNAEEGRKIMGESGLPVTLVGTLKEAAAKLQEVVAS